MTFMDTEKSVDWKCISVTDEETVIVSVNVKFMQQTYYGPLSKPFAKMLIRQLNTGAVCMSSKCFDI